MYIRIKISKSKELRKYAYLVTTKWRKTKTPKQKVKKYLGRVYTLEKQNQYIKRQINSTLTYKRFLKYLIKEELFNHHFQELKKDKLTKDSFLVDLTKNRVIYIDTKKEITLELNNNFLNSYTLSKAMNYKPSKNLTNRNIGKEFAKTIISTGIEIPNDLFIELFKKLNLKTQGI